MDSMLELPMATRLELSPATQPHCSLLTQWHAGGMLFPGFGCRSTLGFVLLIQSAASGREDGCVARVCIARLLGCISV